MIALLPDKEEVIGADGEEVVAAAVVVTAGVLVTILLLHTQDLNLTLPKSNGDLVSGAVWLEVLLLDTLLGNVTEIKSSVVVGAPALVGVLTRLVPPDRAPASRPVDTRVQALARRDADEPVVKM